MIAQANTIDRTRPRILVVGDVMLDVYSIGTTTRLSPEAPVPVLLNPDLTYQLGGAANVAAMCAALGAETILCGGIGDDSAGRKVRHLLDAAGVQWAGLVHPGFSTTTKERVIARGSGGIQQQICRVDYETTDWGAIGNLIGERLRQEQPGFDVVLVSDYGKGVCSLDVLGAAAGLNPRQWIVDPPAGGDWSKYRYYDCLVTNRHKAVNATAHYIAHEMRLTCCVITLDRDGVSWCEEAHEEQLRQSLARRVVDVTGAGDQFLATLGIFRAFGAPWVPAICNAAAAAGLQVERQGCVPVTLDELREALKETSEDADSIVAA